MRKNDSLRRLAIAMALASTSLSRAAAAEDSMICITPSIFQENRDGKIVRPFATEDAVGSRLVGPLTDDPARLTAYVTVARDRLYIYSNFRSEQGFSTKIMTDQVGVGLARLSYGLLNGRPDPKPGDPRPERFTKEACRDAFPRMTFLFDERLRDDPKYGRMALEGALVRTVPAYATANLIARVVQRPAHPRRARRTLGPARRPIPLARQQRRTAPGRPQESRRTNVADRHQATR